MATTQTNPSGFWNQKVWNTINGTPPSNGNQGTPGLVQTTAAAVRVSQNVFLTVQLPGVTSVPADQFDANEMSITEGITEPYIELAVEFPLTNGQVNSDTAGCAAMTLSKFAARDLALAEDIIILQGRDRKLPKSVKIESGQESLKGGIMGRILKGNVVPVNVPPDIATNNGGEIWAAIQNALGLLTDGTQSVPWAIIADTEAFAAISGSVLNGNPLLNLLNGIITGGIYGSPAMPDDTAVVIALGGDPTTIYYDDDAQMEPTYKGGAGKYFFRVFERIQIVARDPRAFVKLDFSYLSSPKRIAKNSPRRAARRVVKKNPAPRKQVGGPAAAQPNVAP